MRIAFLGTPEIARVALVALVEAGHEIACVVTQPDRPKGRSGKAEPPPVKQEALARGLAPILQPERLRAEDAFAALAAAGPFDLGVVCAYGQILEQRALDLPRLGMVNVHASLLPRWRGAAPVQRALLAGDAETGVTIMRVVRRLDAGPMLSWARTKIRADDTGESLLARLGDVGAALLVETLPRLAGGQVNAVEQSEPEATYAPVIAKDEGALDWMQRAEVLERHVRAMQPWPGSYAFIHRRGASPAAPPQRLVVTRARVAPWPAGCGPEPPGAILGPDAASGGCAVLVACAGPSALGLIEVQPAGKRRMDARAWWIGRHAETGDRLGGESRAAATSEGAPV